MKKNNQTKLDKWIKHIADVNLKIPTLFDNCKNMHEVNVIKNKLIGKKSTLRALFSALEPEFKKTQSIELIKIKEKIINQFNLHFKMKIHSKKSNIPSLKIPSYFSFKEKNGNFYTDINNEQPQTFLPLGNPHPISLITEKIHDFFQIYGFTFRKAVEMESTKFNFDYLNIPLEHPSRQKTDTFFLDEKTILRTHATNMTAHILTEYAQQKKPIFAYTLGNVYRNDTHDSTHLNRFTQLDVCMIGGDLSLANLKWLLRKLCDFLLGSKIEIRFRSNYFPFTEPSFEVDIREKSQSQLKTKWIEILGAGVVNPIVLKKCGVQEDITALAFGLGLERIAMMKYKITDIRDLYHNSLKLKK